MPPDSNGSDDRPPKPPGEGTVLPFPGRRPEQDPPSEMELAWQDELSGLEEEPAGRRCRLTVIGGNREELLEFMSATGVEGLAMISRRGGRLVITADRETVARLIVWRALELGLDFRVEFPKS